MVAAVQAARGSVSGLSGVGNDRDDNALNGDSWTDVEQSPPREQLEFVPVRRGMVLADRWAIEESWGRGGWGSSCARATERWASPWRSRSCAPSLPATGHGRSDWRGR